MSTSKTDDPESRVLAHKSTPEWKAARTLYATLTSFAATFSCADVRRDTEQSTRRLFKLVGAAHGEGTIHRRASLYRELREQCAKVSAILEILRISAVDEAAQLVTMERELAVIARCVFREIGETIAFAEFLQSKTHLPAAVDDEELRTDPAACPQEATTQSAPTASEAAGRGVEQQAGVEPVMNDVVDPQRNGHASKAKPHATTTEAPPSAKPPTRKH